MRHLSTMRDLFIHDLRDVYDAEQQLVPTIPEMAQAAASPELREALNTHLGETRNHVQRLTRIFDELGESPDGVECEGMKGLIAEGQEIVQADGDRAVKDAALIAAAQRIEHYEMAAYGTVRTYAKELGFDRAANLLQQTLDEEGDADDTLTDLATGGLLETGINEKAAALTP